MGSSSNSTASPSTSTQTQTVTNSYNTTKNWNLSNIGNMTFGDQALQTASGQDTALTQYIPYALALVGLLVVVSFFKGRK